MTTHIIGVPLDHGAGRRGVGMGPSAMRIAKLHESLRRIGWNVVDQGDIHIPAPEIEDIGEANARYLNTVATACTDLARQVERSLDQGAFPLVIGGDHSIAIGTISGIADWWLRGKGGMPRPASIGVVWFDAHGDINTPESSETGNIHGMPVSCLLGHGPAALTSIGYAGAKLEAGNIIQIGLRDLDDAERRLIREFGVVPYTMADIDQRGMASIVREAIGRLAGCDHIHVSFDIDVVDPRIAPGTGTPKLGGITYREAHLAMEMLAESNRVASLEMVEVNPILDTFNQTSEIAVGLIASAMGKRIL